MRGTIKTALASAILATAGAAHADVLFDFETPGQYAGNFRRIANTNNGNPSQTAPGGADGGLLRLSGSSAYTSVYDTTPADGALKSTFSVSQGSPVSVSMDLRAATATSSFGIYFIDPSNETKGYLALLNIDNPSTSTNEVIRFSSDPDPTNQSSGGTLQTGATGNAFALNEFANAVFTYGINSNNNPVLSVTAGSLSGSITFTNITNPLTEVEVALRVSAQNPTTSARNDLDNVRIVGVPEPASLGLWAGASLLLMRRRRVGA